MRIVFSFTFKCNSIDFFLVTGSLQLENLKWDVIRHVCQYCIFHSGGTNPVLHSCQFIVITIVQTPGVRSRHRCCHCHVVMVSTYVQPTCGGLEGFQRRTVCSAAVTTKPIGMDISSCSVQLTLQRSQDANVCTHIRNPAGQLCGAYTGLNGTDFKPKLSSPFIVC